MRRRWLLLEMLTVAGAVMLWLLVWMPRERTLKAWEQALRAGTVAYQEKRYDEAQKVLLDRKSVV